MSTFSSFFSRFILLIYFWLHWVFVVAHGFSLVEVSGGYSLLWCVGFSLLWLLLLQRAGCRRVVFSSCGSQALGHRHSNCGMSLVAPWHVGSSPTRDQTPVPCTGRRILNHCATRKAPSTFFFY